MGSAPPYAFEARGLTKQFGAVTALAGVDLAATAGSVLGVLGPNGAGKTTAVRILATLLRADAGQALVNGVDVTRHPGRVRRMIGLTGQYASVDEDLTGRENLVMIGRLVDLRGRDAKARAITLLDQFGLTEAADRQAKTYSGGMRRRLDLAAGLVGHPSVLYLDEPTTGLDPAKREDVWQIIRTLTGEGMTILLTTQYLEEADALADEISVFQHGAVIAHGSPADLKRLVGGQSLSVRPADPAHLAAVTAIVTAVAGQAARSPERGVVSVPVESDAVLPEVIARLAGAGITVTELSLHLPSLDEVFFTLTGRPRAVGADDQERAV